jgi:hypothetical protein
MVSIMLIEEDGPRVSGQWRKDATLGSRRNWSCAAMMGFRNAWLPPWPYPTPVLVLIHLLCLAPSLLLDWGTIQCRCDAAPCTMLAWTFCCDFSIIPRLLMIIIKHALYAGLLISLTHIRALLVLHDRGILAHTTIASLGFIPRTEVNQTEKETQKNGLRC